MFHFLAIWKSRISGNGGDAIFLELENYETFGKMASGKKGFCFWNNFSKVFGKILLEKNWLQLEKNPAVV